MFQIGKVAVLLLVFYIPKNEAENYITTSAGEPVPSKIASLTVGPRGPMLLADYQYIDEMAHFDRERIAERVVHAKGTGAFGYFEVTNDITNYTGASLFSEIGKRTRVGIRFSTTTAEAGSADTVFDLRGYSIKFYTDEGNFDIPGLQIPVFSTRDPINVPSLTRAGKRRPDSNLRSADTSWDFRLQLPEGINQAMWLFSPLGIPDGYRHMNGHGVNTYSLINLEGELVYCKFHFITNQGIRNLTTANATTLAGSNPDYAVKDLYDAIENGNFPSWTMMIQVMTKEQAACAPFNPFDNTKYWHPDDYPLIEVGTVVLNENPVNWFAQIEQMALAPSNLVPGVRPSPDRILQGRIFSYSDAQRYRLGINHNQIPVNRPMSPVHTYMRDGFATIDNQGNATNYYPNTVDNLTISERATILAPSYWLAGHVERYDMTDDDNFSHPARFYEELEEWDKSQLASNVAANIKSIIRADLKQGAIDLCGNVSEDLRQRIETILG